MPVTVGCRHNLDEWDATRGSSSRIIESGKDNDFQERGKRINISTWWRWCMRTGFESCLGGL